MKSLFHEIQVKLLWYLKYKKEYKQEGKTKPFAIHIDTRPKRVIAREKEKYDQFLKHAAQVITPNRRTVLELIEYIKQKYDAEEYTIDPREYRIDLFNVLKSDYEDIFNDPILKNFEFIDLIMDEVHRSTESQKRVDYLLEKIKKYHLTSFTIGLL